MTFIIITIALALELMFVHFERIKGFGWISGYRDKVIGIFKSGKWDGPVGVLAILFVPVAAMAWLQTSDFYKNSMFGLAGIIIGVFVLAYCLRYRPMDQAIDGLVIEDGSDKDTLDANEMAAMQEILGQKEPPTQHRYSILTEAVLVQANERLFSVLFWFLIFGPAGALAYRICWYLNEYPLDPGPVESGDDDIDAASYRLFGILSWVPARISAAGYALAGHFEDALNGWSEQRVGSQYDFCKSNNAVLGKAGMGALHISRYESIVESEDEPVDKMVNADAVRAARALVLKTLLLGCTIIALVTLTGWFVA